MLRDDFYTVIQNETRDAGAARVMISFNAKHNIFEGHFPGLPVVPGVCMMAIVKEILESDTGRTLRLEQTSQIKFLSLINPVQHHTASVEINYSNKEDGSILADSAILVAGSPFFKMTRAVYR